MNSTGRPRRASSISTARPNGRSFSPRVLVRRRPTLNPQTEEISYMEPTKLPRIPTMLPSSPISMDMDATITSTPPALDMDDIGSPFEVSTPTPRPRIRPVSCPLPMMIGASQSLSKHGGGSSLSSTISARTSPGNSISYPLEWPPGYHQRQPHPNMLPQTTSRPGGPNRIILPPHCKYRGAPEKYGGERRYEADWLDNRESQSVHSGSTNNGTRHKRKPSGPKEIVYDLTKRTFRYEYRSILIPKSDVVEPLVEYPENQPPLHVDGRMTIVQIPKWKKEIKIYYRICVPSKAALAPRDPKEPPMGDLLTTKVKERMVKLPLDVWIKRNLGFSVGGVKILSLEEGFGLKWKKAGQSSCKEMFIEKSAHTKPKAE